LLLQQQQDATDFAENELQHAAREIEYVRIGYGRVELGSEFEALPANFTETVRIV
jgi:hypothetical protein